MERKGRQSLNVDLGALKPRVLDEAEREGKKSAGAWVRDVVAMALQEHSAEPVPIPASTRRAPQRGTGSWVTVTARLSQEEAHALEAGALEQELTKNEYIGRLALGGVGAARRAALDAMGPLARTLAALESELQALTPRLADPQAQAQAMLALRDVRAQARRVAVLLDEVSTTRRQAGRKQRGAAAS